MNKYKNSNKRTSCRLDLWGWLLPLGLLLIWFLTTRNGKIPPYILPAPGKLAGVILDFIFGNANLTPYSGKMFEHLFVSCIRVLKGFLTAAVLGVSLGFLTGRILIFRRIFDPFIHALRSIPGIGWLPIAIVWFSVGEKSTHFLISLATFFPIYMNTQQGAADVPALYSRAGQMLGAGRISLFLTVTLPAAFPCTAVGLRLGLGISWAYVVLGEVTGVTKGIGAIMTDARMLGHVDIVLTSMVIIAVVGKLFDLILVSLCNLFYPLKTKIHKEVS